MQHQPRSSSFQLLTALTQAWKLSHKNKSTLWTAFILIIAINLLAKFALSSYYNFLSPRPIHFDSEIPLHLLVVYQLIAGFLSGPLYAGMIMTSLKICRKQPVSTSTHFETFNRCLPLAVTGILVALFAASANLILFCIFHFTHINNVYLPFITSAVYPIVILSFLTLTFPLIADRQYNIRRSFWVSINTMRRQFNWGKVLFCYSLLLCLATLLLMVLGYALWTDKSFLILLTACAFIVFAIRAVPFLYLFNAYVYHTITQSTPTALAPNEKNG